MHAHGRAAPAGPYRSNGSCATTRSPLGSGNVAPYDGSAATGSRTVKLFCDGRRTAGPGSDVRRSSGKTYG